jgi:hypothetical protein
MHFSNFFGDDKNFGLLKIKHKTILWNTLNWIWVTESNEKKKMYKIGPELKILSRKYQIFYKVSEIIRG